ncbi:hypothetical protein OC834_007928, partial [Tilletia horrida]
KITQLTQEAVLVENAIKHANKKAEEAADLTARYPGTLDKLNKSQEELRKLKEEKIAWRAEKVRIHKATAPK